MIDRKGVSWTEIWGFYRAVNARARFKKPKSIVVACGRAKRTQNTYIYTYKRDREWARDWMNTPSVLNKDGRTVTMAWCGRVSGSCRLQVVCLLGNQAPRRVPTEGPSPIAEPLFPSLSTPYNSLDIKAHRTIGNFTFPLWLSYGAPRRHFELIFTTRFHSRKYFIHYSWIIIFFSTNFIVNG